MHTTTRLSVNTARINFLLVLMCWAFLFESSAYAQNQQARTILEKMVGKLTGGKRLSSISRVEVDYDNSTNYRYQQRHFNSEHQYSNRPGNTFTYIDLEKQIFLSELEYQYMDAIYAQSIEYVSQQVIRINHVANTYTSQQADFDSVIREDLLRQPLLLMKHVVMEEAKYISSEQKQSGRVDVIGINVAGIGDLELVIRQSTAELIQLSLKSAKSTIDYYYHDYQKLGKIYYPSQIVKTSSNTSYPAFWVYKVISYLLQPQPKQMTKRAVSILKKPASDTVDGKLRIQNLGEGITWITKNAANTLFIEFNNQVLVVDAFGRNVDERIQAFKTLSNKPIKMVSISHHHHDHIRAVPKFNSMGATFITTPEIASLLRTQFTPLLSDLFISEVNGRLTLKDADQHIEFYELRDFKHAKSMLLTYLPRQKLVYLPDHYEEMYLEENKPAIQELLDFIDKRQLSVKGFIQGHGNDLYSTETIDAAMKQTTQLRKLKRQPHHSVVDVSWASKKN